MIVCCPSCKSRYLVDPLALGVNGRTVRCAKCSYAWKETPTKDMPSKLESGDEYIPTKQEPIPIPPGSNLPAIIESRHRASRLSWLLLATFILVIIGGGILAHQPIINKWPQLSSFYASIGFDQYELNNYRLQIRNYSLEEVLEGGVPIIIIKGEVHNSSHEDLKIPPIRVVLIDNNELELDYRIFSAGNDILASGDAVEFLTQIPSPPKGTTNAIISFWRNSNNLSDDD